MEQSPDDADDAILAIRGLLRHVASELETAERDFAEAFERPTVDQDDLVLNGLMTLALFAESTHAAANGDLDGAFEKLEWAQSYPILRPGDQLRRPHCDE